MTRSDDEMHGVSGPLSELVTALHSHTDVKRPEMWPKLNRGKTTEVMSVVSISLDYVSLAHLAVKKNLT